MQHVPKDRYTLSRSIYDYIVIILIGGSVTRRPIKHPYTSVPPTVNTRMCTMNMTRVESTSQRFSEHRFL